MLVEGGPTVLGSLADAQAIDEVWAFVAPTIIGGAAAPSQAAMVNARSAQLLKDAQIRTTNGAEVFIAGVP
jgi:riboflavin biosynthesis pyrimidine reductase